MLARSIDLFTRQGEVTATAAAAEQFESRPIADQFAESIHNSGLDSLFPKNPCVDCALLDFCGDDCGRHLFELDVNDPYQLDDYE